jgi:ribosomal protein S18 acetylase RimI-like enzyme
VCRTIAYPAVSTPYRLARYNPSLADRIAAWAVDAAELDAWASLTPEQAGPAVFERWHAEPSVHPFVLWNDREPCGYGEVWEDDAEDEAELARIIVDPAVRGQGAGRALTGLLIDQARELGYDQIWLRVVPDNGAAIACYSAAGMLCADAAQERSFNAGQPREYRWMRSAPSG